MEYTFNPCAAKENALCSRMLKVNGKGIVEAEPDMAILSLGIVTKDKNPQIAQSQNEQISRNVINALLKVGIPKDDIKTASYTIFPEYDFTDGEQILTGYNVTHVLEVRLRDISKVGAVLGLAVQNGVNQINSVNFTVEDAKLQYNKALKLAVKDAAQKANAITSAMRVDFDSIPCRITEQSTSITPLADQGALKLAAVETVMPGKIEITAMVEAEFQYSK